MKLKSAVLLAFALCCGLVAMLGVQQMVSKNNKQAVVNKKKILVAVANVDAGTPLDDTMVKFVDWPASSVPTGAITKPDEFAERALLTQVFEGTPILASMLGEKGQAGASMAIPVGFRLFSIPVNETKTSSGQIRPGDRVDILVTYKNKNVQTTKTLLEFIQVFSVDSHRTVEANKNEVKTKNVGLLITPEQTQVISLAKKLGEIELALRNKNDTEIVNTPEMIDSLLREMNGSNIQQQETTQNPASVPAYETAKLQAATPQVQLKGTDIIAQQQYSARKNQNVEQGPSFFEKLSKEAITAFTTKKEKQKPSWNVQIFTGDDLENVEFEQHGKKKEDWIYKVAVVPAQAPKPAAPVAAPAPKQKAPAMETINPKGNQSPGQNPNDVLNFLNDIGWSKSQEPGQQGL